MEKLNIFETNKYIYVEKAVKKFQEEFPDAEQVVLNWQHEKKTYWKLEITDANFTAVFDYLKHYADSSDYYFADVPDSLEGNSANKMKIYNISFWLPQYDWGMSDAYLAQWLMNLFKLNQDLHVKTISANAEGLEAISKPLYKYIFSLLGERETRREGLINSWSLLDSENSLIGLIQMTYVRIHAKERHPESRRPDFDPDAYIKDNLESAKELFDPDDMPY